MLARESEAKAIHLRPASVLIADDSPDNRKLLIAMLAPDGHTILEAEDGEQALLLAPQADIILLDITMPGPDGLEVCRRLRRSPQTRFLPIVLVTALDARSDRLAGIEAGADDFLTKPVDRTQLTARVRALLRLKQQKDDAERLRDEFTAMIVHDLRSPLTAIIGFAELLASDLTESQRESCTGYITSSARQMLQMIADLLDLSRLAAESAPRRLAEVASSSLLQDTVALMTPLADGRNLTLKADVPADLPGLTADPSQLRQVLTNLLDNAIKFAAHAVTVSAGTTADGLQITVDDDGPGVPETEWPLLFEVWHQSDLGHRSGKGSGLGLAIAKRLVELHGGTLQAGRSDPGGLRMTIRLPLT
jgi:two-component system sensor histidine kinase/response regulator